MRDNPAFSASTYSFTMIPFDIDALVRSFRPLIKKVVENQWTYTKSNIMRKGVDNILELFKTGIRRCSVDWGDNLDDMLTTCFA